MSEGRRKKAIDSIINALTSEDLILSYPNFEKEFHLTTDASNVAIGDVLCQEGRPITFISRALSEEEERYATNDRETLAIVLALDNLRNYLYGKANVITTLITSL